MGGGEEFDQNNSGVKMCLWIIVNTNCQDKKNADWADIDILSDNIKVKITPLINLVSVKNTKCTSDCWAPQCCSIFAKGTYW